MYIARLDILPPSLFSLSSFSFSLSSLSLSPPLSPYMVLNFLGEISTLEVEFGQCMVCHTVESLINEGRERKGREREHLFTVNGTPRLSLLTDINILCNLLQLTGVQKFYCQKFHCHVVMFSLLYRIITGFLRPMILL